VHVSFNVDIMETLQAPLLKKYPANLSVAALSYFFGTVLMCTTAFFMVKEPLDWKLTQSEVLAVIYAVSYIKIFFSSTHMFLVESFDTISSGFSSL